MPDPKIRYGNDYRIAIGIEYSYNAGGTEAPVGEAPSATSWANLGFAWNAGNRPK